MVKTEKPEHFDDEIERVLVRSGRAAWALSFMALLTLIFGIFGGVGFGVAGDGPRAGFGVFLGAFGTAALLYGLSMVINLLGMQLMETWRQGKHPNPQEDSPSR